MGIERINGKMFQHFENTYCTQKANGNLLKLDFYQWEVYHALVSKLLMIWKEGYPYTKLI
jgi:hypothetical protein